MPGRGEGNKARVNSERITIACADTYLISFFYSAMVFNLLNLQRLLSLNGNSNFQAPHFTHNTAFIQSFCLRPNTPLREHTDIRGLMY